MKVAIYSRKSKFTGKGESVENQIEMCKEYAKQHFDNIEEFFVYEDEGFSGGDTDRPKFQMLLQDSKKKKFDILICYRLDRISRNVLDFSSTLELLNKHDIDFVSIKEQFDTSTPMGRAMMYIASVFAQLERETAAERIRDNMHQLAKSGRWLGGNTPTGFKSKAIIYFDSDMKERKMFKLSPVPEELETVKLLFDKYIEFQSMSKLETWCMQKNIKSRNNKYFHKYALRQILINPVYAVADSYMYDYFTANEANVTEEKSEWNGRYGVMPYNKNLVKKGQSVKRKDMSEWIVAIGRHKGVISGKKWIQVQNTINRNKSKAPRQGTSHAAMLSGILRCQKCNTWMQIKYGQISKETGKRHYYYVCNRKVISKGEKCKIKNLQGSRTDQEVIDILKVAIKKDVLKSLDNKKEQLNDSKLQEKQIKNDIAENKRAIENLIKQLSKTDNDNIVKYIFAEIEKLEKSNKELENKLGKIDTEIQTINIELLKDYYIDFAENIDNVPYEQKRNLIKNITNKIIWDGENLKVDLIEV